MAYDEALAARIRDALANHDGIVEKKMFGGVAYMLNGNMAAGGLNDDLMVRVGPDAYEDALNAPHTRPFDARGGRPMRGFVAVEPAGVADDAALLDWLHKGLAFAGSLPPK